MEIYEAAHLIMKNSGNPTQWPVWYPSREMTEEAAKAGKLYVVRSDDGIIHACFYMAKEEDPTYAVIENGQWRYNEEYAVLHRIAQDGSLKGTLKMILDYAFSLYSYVRIDTHEDNVIMRKLLSRYGFVASGTIFVLDGKPRIAFERKEDGART